MNSISELTNDKVQEIIDNFSKQEDEFPIPEISARGPCQNHVTKNSETSERIINALLALESTEVNTSANVSSAFQSKPTYDRSYFRNKTLDQYPNLYREFNSENSIIMEFMIRHYAHYASLSMLMKKV